MPFWKSRNCQYSSKPAFKSCIDQIWTNSTPHLLNHVLDPDKKQLAYFWRFTNNSKCFWQENKVEISNNQKKNWKRTTSIRARYKNECNQIKSKTKYRILQRQESNFGMLRKSLNRFWAMLKWLIIGCIQIKLSCSKLNAVLAWTK